MEQKRNAEAMSAPSLDLSGMWQGDLAAPLVAFLQLNSIGVVGRLSRRFRDQLPAVFFNLARKQAIARSHGRALNALRASMTGFVEAIRASGRDDSLWRPGGVPGALLESWTSLPPYLASFEGESFNGDTEGDFSAREVSVWLPASALDGNPETTRSIQIDTHPHKGRRGYNVRAGLYKEFASGSELLVDKKLCFREVNYYFCFTDHDPVASHTGLPEQKGFAFFQFGHGFSPSGHQLEPNWCRNQRGLCVEPHSYENGYQIIWFDNNSEDEKVEIMNVKQGTYLRYLESAGNLTLP